MDTNRSVGMNLLNGPESLQAQIFTFWIETPPDQNRGARWRSGGIRQSGPGSHGRIARGTILVPDRDYRTNRQLGNNAEN
ncbi:MAG: hypothetical protein O2960_23745 [Verrucomicrobia bacterium]|nr:hypothetical protein [Verrucomicrobiota bacterium]